MQKDNTIIRDHFIKLARTRGENKTFCPSETKRLSDPNNWISKMKEIKEEGSKLVKECFVIFYQEGNDKNSLTTHSPIRFALA